MGMLMQRYTLLLFGVCMKYLKNEETAKDAVQQIFLKAISEMRKYPVTYFVLVVYGCPKLRLMQPIRRKCRFR